MKVDITPTWEAILPLLVEAAANGTTVEGRREAMSELIRLASLADTRIPQLVALGQRHASEVVRLTDENRILIAALRRIEKMATDGAILPRIQSVATQTLSTVLEDYFPAG